MTFQPCQSCFAYAIFWLVFTGRLGSILSNIVSCFNSLSFGLNQNEINISAFVDELILFRPDLPKHVCLKFYSFQRSALLPVDVDVYRRSALFETMFCFKLFCSPCSCILAEHPPEIHWQDDIISTKTLVKNTNGKSRDAGGIITLVGFPVLEARFSFLHRK